MVNVIILISILRVDQYQETLVLHQVRQAHQVRHHPVQAVRHQVQMVRFLQVVHPLLQALHLLLLVLLQALLHLQDLYL
jgi:hypothetical protein